MISRLLPFLFVALTYTAVAQPPVESTVLPDGPLVRAQAPETSQWVVEYQYGDKPKAAKEHESQKGELEAMAVRDPAVAALLKAQPGLAAQMDPPRLTVVRVTRTASVRHERCSYDRGGLEEHWFANGYALSRTADDPRIQVVSGARLATVDFPEFAWVKRENYRSAGKTNGRDCWTFQMEIHPMQIEDPVMYQVLLDRQRNQEPRQAAPTELAGGKATVIAVIDAETRLPIALRLGKNTRLYHFQPTPPPTLALPPEWQQATQQHDADHRRATRSMSRP